MQSKPVGWFEIYVQDLPRAKAFYESVFALQLEKLESPDPSIELLAFPALVKMEACASGGNSVIIYFMCKDCAVQAGRVAASGGQVAKPKFAIGKYGFVAHVIDTEGNTIGLHSMQ